MANHTGKFTPSILGGGKNIQRYPPTVPPIINEAAIQPKNNLFLSFKIIYPARRFAIGPKNTSIGLRNQYILPIKAPNPTPATAGIPIKADNGIKQSATLS